MSKTYIISYPRSGNTLVRTIIEYITGRPTNGLCGKPDPKDVLQKPIIHKDSTDYIAHKRHDFNGVTPEDEVIFILRDYKEAIIRHNEAPRGLPTIEQFESYTAGTQGDYIGLLRAFHKHSGYKCLVSYEELKEGEFFPDLISNLYHEITPKMLRVARKAYPNPQSKGANDFHKFKLTKEQRIQWDESLKRRFPELFDKYLKQYEER